MTQVKAWNEKMKIPTYGIGKPEKNAILLKKGAYQEQWIRFGKH
ncbi:MAG: hypothetical protein AAGU19_23015 [Prolixibacteraceae bacterium]